MRNNPIKKIVIAGGGTAGWMTAAALGKLLGSNLDITLIESEEIGTVGVGEATIPTLHLFHDLLKINEAEFMAATNATFKLGIAFEKWKNTQDDYIHSFGHLGPGCWAAGFQHFWLKGQEKGFASDIGDYCAEHIACRKGKFAVEPKTDRNHAYHIDAGLYAKLLRSVAEKAGVTRIEGKINKVTVHPENGFISAVTLENGSNLRGDLFVDCTGFKGLLIDGALHTGFEDWRHWLPCDRAVTVQTEHHNAPLPYTRSMAHQCGWQWQIPLQNRVGNGLVYCSRYLSDEQATQQLMAQISGKPVNSPRIISFRTGTRRQHWNKNCVAIGLSSGFVEPLESTSIHLIQQSIIRLMQYLPSVAMEHANLNQFNAKMRQEMENVRDFIVMHYHLTTRSDSDFWRHCARMQVPASLKERLDLFASQGHAHQLDGELFGETSWIQVMLGQGITPAHYHPIVDMMSDQELHHYLARIKSAAEQRIHKMPHHLDFIARYCPAPSKPRPNSG